MQNDVARQAQTLTLFAGFEFCLFHFELKEKCQGDHGRYGANYRCCLPALAGFVSPHSMGPGTANCAGAQRGLQAKSTQLVGRIQVVNDAVTQPLVTLIERRTAFSRRIFNFIAPVFGIKQANQADSFWWNLSLCLQKRDMIFCHGKNSCNTR